MPNRFLLFMSVSLVVSSTGGACKRTEQTPPPGAVTEEKPPAPKSLLVFPSELRVADESANDFVSQAMNICAAKEYEPFRLLWSAREDPMPRDEFEEGWQAVQEIRIHALERVLLAGDGPKDKNDANPPRSPPAAASPAENRDESAARGETAAQNSNDEIVYAVHAEVKLDPAHKAGQREPARQVILMMVREQGEWRLARAPKRMREWLRERSPASTAGDPTKPPADSNGASSP